MFIYLLCFFFFFFNDTATTEIYTLSLHDALPISHILPRKTEWGLAARRYREPRRVDRRGARRPAPARSEEHTSELQSPCNLVCRLLLEKKKKKTTERNNDKRDDTTYEYGVQDGIY